MTSQLRDPEVYREWCDSVVNTAIRTLQAADAQAFPRPWWQGNVRVSAIRNPEFIRVGGVFDLQEDGYGQKRIGYYRIVGMAVAPEGHLSIIAYGGLHDDDLPKNGAPIPLIHFGMLVEV